MEQNILPIGTIVYLEDGTKKIMIVGRGMIINDDDTGEDVYFDYLGCPYPEGVDPDNALFFNNENIDGIVFEGYTNEEEERYVKLYEKWEESLEIEKKRI